MKNPTLYYTSGLLLLTLVFSSCSKEEKMQPNKSIEQESDDVFQHILNLGFKSSDIQDNKTEYIVQGDIIFPKNMIVPKAENGRTGQYYIGSLLNTTNQSDIRIMVDNSMSDMISEINSAINQWNNTNSQIYFRLVSGGIYDILIKDENLGYGICGQAVFPSNGSAGNLVRINKAWISANSFEQRQRTITHEFGHTIGFTHTNYPSDGYDVPGVGGTDASSLMNGGECGTGATQLSTKDKLATEALYPMTTAPVYQFSDSRGNKVYGMGRTNPSFSFEGISFYAFPKSKSGTISTTQYAFSHPAGYSYLTTTSSWYPGNAGTQYGIYGGYSTIGDHYFAYSNQPSGTVPIYRYFDNNNKLFILSKSSSVPSGYINDGVAFYAY